MAPGREHRPPDCGRVRGKGAPRPPRLPPVCAAGLTGAACGGARVRRVVAGEDEECVCGECARECVRACARVPVCARWGRRWRPLRPGSAPAGEGLQGLAPLELGICRRSLSIFVAS